MVFFIGKFQVTESRLANSEEEETITSDENNFVRLYPNPNNGNFVIEYKIAQNATAEIRDVQGKLVCKTNLAANQSNSSITCESLENGVYLFKVLIDNTTLQTKKLIIVK